MSKRLHIPLAVKTAVLVTAIAVAASLVLMVAGVRNTRSTINHEYEDESHRLVAEITERVFQSPDDPEAVDELLSEIVRTHPDVMLIRLFRDTSRRTPAIWASSSATDLLPSTGADVLPPSGATLQSVVTLGDEKAFLNVEGVSLPGGVRSAAFYFEESRRQQVISEAGRGIVGVALIVIVVELLSLALVTYGLILRRVKRLARTAETVAGGDLSARATPTDGNPGMFPDELTDATARFDEMVSAVESRGRQQAAVARVGRSALAGASLGSTLEAAVVAVQEVLDVDVVAAFEHTQEGLVLRAGAGWPDGSVGSVTLPTGAASQSGWTLQTGEPVLMVDRASESRFQISEVSDGLGLVSGATVPIGGVANAYGVLAAHQRVRRAFSQDDIAFLTSMANVLSAAVERESALARERSAEEERRHLLSQLVAAQEDERQRIAIDLHDDPIQTMTAATMRLQAVRNLSTDPRQKELIDRLEGTISGSIERLRGLMFDLRPPALDRDGLSAALRDYLGTLARDHVLDFDLVDRLEGEPDPVTRAAAYRIAKEAVMNALKHAGAAKLSVTLDGGYDGVRVTIADDGKGFDPGNESGADHIGLATMKERARLAGGWFRIDSAQGRGTLVEFFVPAEEETPRDDT